MKLPDQAAGPEQGIEAGIARLETRLQAVEAKLDVVLEAVEKSHRATYGDVELFVYKQLQGKTSLVPYSKLIDLVMNKFTLDRPVASRLFDQVKAKPYFEGDGWRLCLSDFGRKNYQPVLD